MRTPLLAIAASVMLATLICSQVQANPLLDNAVLSKRAQWETRSGESAHWYELYTVDPYISWEEADLTARQLGGYLAVITSPEENQWIFQTFATSTSLYRNGWWGPWLGGRQSTTQPDYSEPNGGWIWANGENWDYTNWSPGEPSNGNGGVESALCYIAYQEIPLGLWNDWAAHDEWPADTPFAFIVEYEADIPLGACCLQGECVSTSLDDCYAAEGSFAGTGVSCDDAGCPPHCQGDITGDGEVNVLDLLSVIDDWGPCP